MNSTQPPLPPRFSSGGRWFFTLADAGQHVVLAGPGDQIGELLSQSDIQNGTPIKINGTIVGTMLSRQPTIRVNPAETAFLTRVMQISALSAVGVIAMGMLLAFLLSRTLTRPIRELTAATRAVSAGKLEQVVPVRSRDELGELAASFNRMNAELTRSIALRRQMTADIAHELRTLETFEIIRDEAERLDSLIEDLRTLSRADAGELPIELQLVSPAKLLEKVLVIHKQRAAQKNIAITWQVAPDLPEIKADMGRMTQVLSNLRAGRWLHTNVQPGGG